MRRLAQFASILVIALLAVLPASEGLACSLHASVGKSHCPMGMSEMSPDCPMGQQMAAAGGLQDCCNHAVPSLVILGASPAKPKIGPVVLLPGIGESAHYTEAALAARGIPRIASSLPHYILNRVFRI